MEKTTIRAFIAVELSENIQQSLKDIQKSLKTSGADVKWVAPHNIHLTLKFLGDIPVEKIQDIADILRSLEKNQNSFSLELAHLDAFPKIEAPRVIWMGISKGKKEIIQLHNILEEKLQLCGFEKENRPFDPHATLGRVRSGMNRLFLVKTIKDWKLGRPLIQKTISVVFYKSTLTPRGPIYEVLEKIFLRGEAPQS